MRLAITFPHSLGAPGGGTHDCVQLARHLASAGSEVVLLPIGSLGPTRFPRPKPTDAWSGVREAEELACDGIEVIQVERHPLHYLLDGRPMRRALQRLLAEREIDAVLGWWNETLFLPRLLERAGVVHAMNAAASYGPLFNAPGSGGLRALRTSLFFTRPLRRADVVFARSEFTRGELVELGGVEAERIRVVHLGVDSVFGEVERAQSSEPLTRILFFGNLVREKGIFDALDALGALKERDWTLRIAGWGDADRVRAHAAQVGIGERIELVGRLERPQLLEALAWAQLALAPSHTESFGLANAEAQAAGLPVVAYSVAAVPEVVSAGETGWLVGLEARGELSAALEEAFDRPEEAHARGLRGRERMQTLFTWERSARTTLAGLEWARARNRSTSGFPSP